jgi:purine nucleosidase
VTSFDPPERRRVVLDTDIGSDVDDVLALAMLLGSPEVDLLGVTTVYGDTVTRARIASRLARLAGRTDVRVVPGERETLSGAPAWWAGHEGRTFADLETEPVSPTPTARSFLARTAEAYAGELDIVAIGPLTNIAATIRSQPSFVDEVRRLYVMGGRFDTTTQAEHNFKSDAEAAAVVFESGISATVVGLEITTQVRMDAEQLGWIAGAGPLGEAVEAEVRAWWAYTDKQWNHPHDPLAVLAMLAPGLFAALPGTVRVDRDGETPGVSRATDHPDSSTRVITEVDVAEVLQEIVDRIDAAGQGAL